MNDWPFFEDNFVYFIISDLHVFEHFFLVLFDQHEKFFILLEGVFDIVFEHTLSIDILSDYFGEGLSS